MQCVVFGVQLTVLNTAYDSWSVYSLLILTEKVILILYIPLNSCHFIPFYYLYLNLAIQVNEYIPHHLTNQPVSLSELQSVDRFPSVCVCQSDGERGGEERVPGVPSQ